MTDLRTAAQQALEVLEDACGDRCNAEYNPCWQREVAETLRAALAEPQMQPCAGRNCGSTNPNLHSAECFEDYEKATGMRSSTIPDRLTLIGALEEAKNKVITDGYVA